MLDINNGLIIEWDLVTENGKNIYRSVTLPITLITLLYANYSMGIAENHAGVAGYNLTSIVDYFTGSTVNVCFRGGDQGNYMRPGWAIFIGY